MKLYTLYRNPYIRPFTYAALLLVALYTAHFAVDLITPMQTSDADQARAAQYLVEHDLPTPDQPFLRDGCTLWPDKLPGHDFNEACLQHDIAYWAGGSDELHRQTNIEFRYNVAKTGPLGPALGVIMAIGVTYFGDNGVSRVINSHWGFGWN